MVVLRFEMLLLGRDKKGTRRALLSQCGWRGFVHRRDMAGGCEFPLARAPNAKLAGVDPPTLWPSESPLESSWATKWGRPTLQGFSRVASRAVVVESVLSPRQSLHYTTHAYILSCARPEAPSLLLPTPTHCAPEGPSADLVKCNNA